MKTLMGRVTSTKMDKTVTVEVVRVKVHPVYKKRTRVKKKFHAHDEIGVKEGDRVKIQESRPMSKTKRWKITEVIKK
jgi:small subunit ribosomal protein S17